MSKEISLASRMAVVLLTLAIVQGAGLHLTFADNYPGKWYGWYTSSYIKQKDLTGHVTGNAFQDEKVISAWGYKARPVEEIKELLPEPFFQMIKHPEIWGGIRINETAYIPLDKWPGEIIKLRNEATEKYKGQPYLDETGYLRNYNAGFPFPGSEEGIKIAWNYDKSRNYGEKQWCKSIFTAVDKKGFNRWACISNNYFWWNGILATNNRKPLKLPNPNNYDWFHAFGYMAPYDLMGIFALTQRYNDPEKDDGQWMYLPSLRRVRRMSTAQRWDKLPGGSDMTWDSTIGFNGKVSNYNWKFLGRKELLCGHNSAFQMQQLKDKPAHAICDQQYQRVNTVVVEYRAKEKLYCPVSKAVMYLDPENYTCYYAEWYDKRGRIWMLFVGIWVPCNAGTIAPGSSIYVDLQRVHTSPANVFQTRDNLNLETGFDFFKPNTKKKYYGGR
ncbi:MAG: DUF1329 domain-containing protein [Deltaproteobacteria bacterium]|nr:DUF1329 domain-containing protein [Deltaproteobacteria bacterium]